MTNANCGALSIVLSLSVGLLFWKKLAPPFRLPVAFYSLAYLVTFAVGASWIGFSEGHILETFWGLDNSVPPVWTSPLLYWSVLWAPIVVVPALVWVFQFGLSRNIQERTTLPSIREYRLDLWSSLIAGTGMLVFILARTDLLSAGTVNSLLDLVQHPGRSNQLVALRLKFFSVEGGFLVFAFLYTAIPLMYHIPLFHSSRGPFRRQFLLVGLGGLGLLLILNLMTFQSGPASLIVIMAVVSLFFAGTLKLKIRNLVLSAIILLGLLAGYHYVKQSSTSLFRSGMHLAMRMPSSYPYYVGFRQTLSFSDAASKDLLGPLVPDPGLPAIVSTRMFPNIPGAQPAPAHISALVEGGLWYSGVVLVFTSLWVSMTGLILSRARQNAFLHSSLIAALTVEYYLTQVSLRDSLWSAYGALSAAIGLIFFYCLKLMMSGLLRPQR